MKIIIEAEPKEIAALVLAVQKQHIDHDLGRYKLAILEPGDKVCSGATTHEGKCRHCGTESERNGVDIATLENDYVK